MDVSPPDSLKSRIHDVDNKILALKTFRNTLIPIGCLPSDILSIIFLLLSKPPFKVPIKQKSRQKSQQKSRPSSPISISHVCHHWRDVSLNMHCLWSHIDSAELTPAGTAKMFARAKMAPLHLEVVTTGTCWSVKQDDVLVGHLNVHIHHIRHLSITGHSRYIGLMCEQLVSSAPSLEQLSITGNSSELWPLVIPDNLFDGIAPKLTYLRLEHCGIRWESPLLKGLQVLKLFGSPLYAQTPLNAWLDALNQMPQLERLSLYGPHGHIPCRSETLLEPGFTVVLSSLKELDVFASAQDCIVVLAHLILPALTRLSVNAETRHLIDKTLRRELISCIARNAYGPQDTEALQSLFIGGKGRAETVAWAMPRQDDTCDGFDFLVNLPDGIPLARVAFSAITYGSPRKIDSPPHDLLLSALPLNRITSLTVKDCASHCRRVWRRHAPRLHKLQRVRLFSTAVPAFREMLENAPSGDPLLPSLEELVLVDVFFNAQKVHYLYNMLVKLVELEVQLTALDLRACIACDRAVQLFSGIVDDVRGPRRRIPEEYGLGEMPLPLESWDIDKGSRYDCVDSDDPESDSDSDYGTSSE